MTEDVRSRGNDTRTVGTEEFDHIAKGNPRCDIGQLKLPNRGALVHSPQPDYREMYAKTSSADALTRASSISPDAVFRNLQLDIERLNSKNSGHLTREPLPDIGRSNKNLAHISLLPDKGKLRLSNTDARIAHSPPIGKLKLPTSNALPNSPSPFISQGTGVRRTDVGTTQIPLSDQERPALPHITGRSAVSTHNTQTQRSSADFEACSTSSTSTYRSDQFSDGTKDLSPSTSFVEDPERQDLLMEYEHLKEVQLYNERKINTIEKTLVEQSKVILEELAVYQKDHTYLADLTGRLGEVQHLHMVYTAENDQLRIEHLSNVLSVTMLNAETEEVIGKMNDVYDQLVDLQQFRALGYRTIARETKGMMQASEMFKAKCKSLEEKCREAKQTLTDLRIEAERQGIGVFDKINPNTKLNSLPPHVDVAIYKEKDNKENTELFSSLQTMEMKMKEKYDIRYITPINTTVKKSRDNKQDVPKEHTRLEAVGKDKSKSQNRLCAVGMEQTEYTNTKTDTEVSGSMRTTNRYVKDSKSWSGIPKPIQKPYGSAGRDGSRFRFSKKLRCVVAKDNYKRFDFVTSGEKHVVTHTLHYLDVGKELVKLKKKYYETYGVAFGNSCGHTSPDHSEGDQSERISANGMGPKKENKANKKARGKQEEERSRENGRPHLPPLKKKLAKAERKMNTFRKLPPIKTN